MQDTSVDYFFAWMLLVFVAFFGLVYANTDDELMQTQDWYHGHDDFLDTDDFDPHG